MLSVIVPTYNEADQVGQTIQQIRAAAGKHEPQILVVDGGSTDDTVRLAEAHGAVVITSARKGRGAQMNIGATVAKGEILYFLHADSIPPRQFIDLILGAYRQGAKSGCFRLAFDHPHWFLKANAWFTRFNVNGLRFGDQSLFVARDIFARSGGFREDLTVMEDQEIIHRLKKLGKFQVLPHVVVTSARKYVDNGVFRMQGIFYLIWSLYYLGFSQPHLVAVYKKLIRKHKL
ncbi:TIGR04283 family arsenosugar biosynthesis glycosyltransferase [Rufibacter hautae]|uniref:Glycosyltransferase n=1 Tax=Rufibacter hautae TaxID=2595005 RepID=A0A5B6TD68_9BACT|nr:TIGR04283 family arsenosugar biosynthesis glycosyltransferase [Rufibacter hautae]KAA3436929.1 glycosyltransferase [Rufibacter hautae]